MQKISIIVPVYNVSQYLGKCLTSLVEQTYSNIEIICVNDGSTDSSGEILDRFVNEDSRICILSQKNSGPSIARNEGLKRCHGDYVLFVDADDYLEADACSNLVDVVSDKDVDVVGFSYKTFPNGHKVSYSMKTEKVLSPMQLLKSTTIPQTSNDLCFMWRYMFKRSFLMAYNIMFDNAIRIGEDMLFMMRVYSLAKNMLLLDYAPYNYRVDNTQSAMHNPAYNPYMEESLLTSYKLKKRYIVDNQWDNVTPFSFDLARYTIIQYYRMLIRNRRAKGESADKYIVEVLNLPMMRDAMTVIGFRNIFTNWKEYMVYLCMKFNILPILKRYY